MYAFKQISGFSRSTEFSSLENLFPNFFSRFSLFISSSSCTVSTLIEKLFSGFDSGSKSFNSSFLISSSFLPTSCVKASLLSCKGSESVSASLPTLSIFFGTSWLSRKPLSSASASLIFSPARRYVYTILSHL